MESKRKEGPEGQVEKQLVPGRHRAIEGLAVYIHGADPTRTRGCEDEILDIFNSKHWKKICWIIPASNTKLDEQSCRMKATGSERKRTGTSSGTRTVSRSPPKKEN